MKREIIQEKKSASGNGGPDLVSGKESKNPISESSPMRSPQYNVGRK